MSQQMPSSTPKSDVSEQQSNISDDKVDCSATTKTKSTPTTTTTTQIITTTLLEAAMKKLLTSPLIPSSSSSSQPPKTVESESQTDIVLPSTTEQLQQQQHKEITEENNNKNGNNNDLSSIKPYHINYLLPSDEDKLVIDMIKQDSHNKDHKIINDTDNLLVDGYLDHPEDSIVQIREKIIVCRNNSSDDDNDSDLHNVTLAETESEEDDELKPLMIDNHPILEHTTEFFGHHKPIQHSDTKESFSSNDSDISLVRDCRNSSSCHGGGESSEAHFSDENTIGKEIGCDFKKNDTIDIKEIDTLSLSEIPDDLLAEEICENVEYYFSNENILKDAFLLKHVRRNKEGFVSLKLVSSFKRVRQLCKDWRAVGHAIRRKSKNIELNDIATKIRRIEPLPSFDETMPSRTIVACDLPVDKLSIERVSDIFSKCGEIALIRILRPGNAIPADVRQFINKYPEMQQKECALVEFVESQSARNAQNLSGSFQIYEMVAPKKKTGRKAVTVTKLVENYKYYDNNGFEKSRGGGVTGIPENDFKFKMRRNSSEYYFKNEHPHICQHQHQQQQQQQQQQITTPQSPRKYSFNNDNNLSIDNNHYNNHHHHFSPRKISNCSMTHGQDSNRKYSSCSEGYSSCSELSRKTSACSSSDAQSRRTSNCSDYCQCTRSGRPMHYNNDNMFRRPSLCSEHGVNNMQQRRFSNGSVNYNNDRNNYINHSDIGRRVSIDSNQSYDRKISSGSLGSTGTGSHTHIYEPYRKFSNGFDPNRKLSNTDQYFNGRRISTDSGYDRKISFGSEYGSSPRSRSNSFMGGCQHKSGENVVRTPIGPDGSKGFTSRTRKLGQTVAPV